MSLNLSLVFSTAVDGTVRCFLDKCGKLVFVTYYSGDLVAAMYKVYECGMLLSNPVAVLPGNGTHVLGCVISSDFGTIVVASVPNPLVLGPNNVTLTSYSVGASHELSRAATLVIPSVIIDGTYFMIEFVGESLSVAYKVGKGIILQLLCPLRLRVKASEPIPVPTVSPRLACGRLLVAGPLPLGGSLLLAYSLECHGMTLVAEIKTSSQINGIDATDEGLVAVSMNVPVVEKNPANTYTKLKSGFYSDGVQESRFGGTSELLLVRFCGDKLAVAERIKVGVPCAASVSFLNGSNSLIVPTQMPKDSYVGLRQYEVGSKEPSNVCLVAPPDAFISCGGNLMAVSGSSLSNVNNILLFVRERVCK